MLPQLSFDRYVEERLRSMKMLDDSPDSPFFFFDEMEKFDLNFQTDFPSLKELSAISMASYLCESSDMKRKMEEALDINFPDWRIPPTSEVRFHFEDLSPEISNMVSRKLSNLKDIVPESIKLQIKKKLLEMMRERFKWMMYLTHDLQLGYEVTEKIYWTSKGHIDDDKIFCNFWVPCFSDTLINWDGHAKNLRLIQYLACFFAQEEFIVVNQMNFIFQINSLQISSLHSENNFDIVCTLMKIFITHYHNKELDLSDLEQTMSIVTIPTTEMLDKCLSFCFHKSFISFWRRLDEEQKYNYLESLIAKKSALKNTKMKYGKNNLFKIVLFLMNEMNEIQRKKFLLFNFPVLFSMFLRRKPFRKFCIPLLDRFLPRLKPSVIQSVTLKCVKDFKLSTRRGKDFHTQIVERLLKYIPLFEIGNPNVVNNSICILLEFFFEIFHLPTLKLIINHTGLRHRKKDLISRGETSYKTLIQNGNLELLNQFIGEVIETEDRNNFRQDFNFLDVLIGNAQFDIADKVLVWTYGPDYYEPKMQLKNIFCRVIPKDYDSIIKLLKWYFGSEKEPLINSCADRFELLYEFCRELIYCIWFPVRNFRLTDSSFIESSTRSCSEISTNTLMFVFGDQERVQDFITNVLAKQDDFVEFIRANICIPDCRVHGIVVQFLEFCSVPKSSIRDIKVNRKHHTIKILPNRYMLWNLKNCLTVTNQLKFFYN